MRNATLEDVNRALNSPCDFTVNIREKSDPFRSDPKRKAVNQVNLEQRFLVVGDWPTGANPVMVLEQDITSLQLTFE